MVGISPAAIAVAAGQEVQSIFRDAGTVLIQGEGAYLRDGEPESISGFISQAAGRSACRIYAANPSVVNASAGVRYERVCKPYLDSIGLDLAPELELPARGGQCPVSYVIDYEIRNRVSGQFSCQPFSAWTQITGSTGNPSGTLVGPISGPTEITTITASPPGTNRTQRFAVIAANRETNINLGGAASRPYWEACGPAYEVRNVRFRRADGQADSCGSQPPVVIPRRPEGNPTPPPERVNPRPDLDVDIEVTINEEGDITFNIGTGPITVDIDGRDEGGGGGDGGGSTPNPDGPPGDVGQPGTPQAPGAGGESSGCAPAGQVLTGIKIDFLEIPSDARPYAPGVYRAVCYAYLGTQQGLDHDPAGAMMRDGQFIFAEKSNLTCWAVRANLGWSLRTTPYYRELEE